MARLKIWIERLKTKFFYLKKNCSCVLKRQGNFSRGLPFFYFIFSVSNAPHSFSQQQQHGSAKKTATEATAIVRQQRRRLQVVITTAIIFRQLSSDSEKENGDSSGGEYHY
jgi:hypothetical protein